MNCRFDDDIIECVRDYEIPKLWYLTSDSIIIFNSFLPGSIWIWDLEKGTQIISEIQYDTGELFVTRKPSFEDYDEYVISIITY